MGSLDVRIGADRRGRPVVKFRERDTLPTAAEIEAAYDHSRHPSPHLRGKAK
jgi:hypothetical protein